MSQAAVEIDWGDVSAESVEIEVVDSSVVEPVSSVEEGVDEPGLARGDDALTLLDHVPTRNQIVNQLTEVRISRNPLGTWALVCIFHLFSEHPADRTPSSFCVQFRWCQTLSLICTSALCALSVVVAVFSRSATSRVAIRQ